MPHIARPTRPLADVNVLPQSDGSNKIVVCFMPDMRRIYGEGTIRAFLAIDGSASMCPMYGIGSSVFMKLQNYVEAVAIKIGKYLTEVTNPAKAASIYWAVSPDGGKIEGIGEFDETGWDNAKISGPKTEKWGKGTKLLPSIKYGWETVFPGSKCTIGVIITDGIIDDEQDCINYCLQIGQQLNGQEPAPFKLVIIGAGESVDEGQLDRLNDMFEGTGIDYDLFGAGLVSNMKEEADILNVLYGELMTKDTIIANNGRVEDSKGNVLISWSDAMPGKFEFKLPKGEKQFTIRVPGADIVQDVSEAIP